MLWSAFEDFNAEAFFNDEAVEMFERKKACARRKVEVAKWFKVNLGGDLVVNVLYAYIDVVDSTRLVHPIMEDVMERRSAKFFLAIRNDGDEVIYSVRTKRGYKQSCLWFVEYLQSSFGGSSAVGNSVSGELRMSKTQADTFNIFMKRKQMEPTSPTGFPEGELDGSQEDP
eukprot:GHVS01002047.1.p1 GENE.GHVS01002047.1~~GHVS01002047.1.p1  ORF type:complete len:171 (+),score=19.39 GHVS01002047.1:2-514(+)